MSCFPCPAPCASERREKPRLRATDTRPGHERLLAQSVAERGVSPALPPDTKVLQKRKKTAADGDHSDQPRADTVRQRSARTDPPSSTALSRPIRSGAMRLSSCAQTADEHVTTRTPSRWPVGSAWAATTSPTACGQ